MPDTNPDRWLELAPYLEDALDLASEPRALWLSALAARDPELAAQLKPLLAEHDSLAKEGFMSAVPPTPVPEPGLAGQTIGPYKLISIIGHGGMGNVWLAERTDGRFERRVAVKFLNLALLDPTHQERFRREGSILGRLLHPHIAELVDAGVAASGFPYLVLEYVQGEPITSYCDLHKLTIEDRVRLFLDIGDAVSYAHRNLVVHRDLKPSNVLVRKDGQVKLLDFGIAKLIGGQEGDAAITALTAPGVHAMTPEFAAPEQVTAAAITTATDVYALGVLLFILLTGQHPVGPNGLASADLLKAIVHTEPRPLSEVVSDRKIGAQTTTDNAASRTTTPGTLQKLLRGDLDTIVAKALKKDPAERYASVAALVEDLKRYLNHEPIAARPDSFGYRAAKFIRRNRTAVAFATVAALAATAGIIAILWQSQIAREQRDFAYLQLKRSHEHDQFFEFLLSDAAPGGKPFTVNDLLARAQRMVEKQHSNNPARRADLLMWIGADYSVREQQSQALRDLEQAYQLARTLDDRSLRAQTSCLLADTLAQDVDLKRAQALIEEGLRELSPDPRFDVERIDCLRQAAGLWQSQGDIQKALVLIQEAVRLAQTSPLATDVTRLRASGDLANTLSSAGLDAEALAEFQKAAALLSSLGWDETQTGISLYSDWALELDQVGRPLDAEQVYRHVLDVARDSNTTEAVTPMVLTNYARILRELNRLDEASNYAARSYEKAKAADDELVMSQSLLERARIAVERKDFPRASAFLAEVDPRLHKDLPPGHYAFAALSSERAMVALGNHSPALALKLSNQAVEIDEAAIKAGGMGAFALPGFLVRRSTVELAGGNPEQALADANRALTLLESNSGKGAVSSRVGLAYLALARALVALGKNYEAQSAAKFAATHLEKSLGSPHPDTIAARRLADSSSRSTR